MNHWQRRSAIAAAESKGVEVTIPAYPGWAFTIRRRCQWNADYQRAIARLSVRSDLAELIERQRAFPDLVMSVADRELDAAMMREAFAEGCMIGWRGVTGPDDKPFPFTLGNAVTLLEAFPDIYAELATAAVDASRFAPVALVLKTAAARGN